VIQIGDAKLNRPLLGYWMRQPAVKIPSPYYVTLPASAAEADILTTTITLAEVGDIKAHVSGMCYCSMSAAGDLLWGVHFELDGIAPADQTSIDSRQFVDVAGDVYLNISICYQWEGVEVGEHELKLVANESWQTGETRRIYRACMIPEICKGVKGIGPDITVTRSTVGTQHETQFAGLFALPAWLTADLCGEAGTVTVAGGLCTIDRPFSTHVFVRSTAALPALPAAGVVRVKLRYNQQADFFPNVGIVDAATAPTYTGHETRDGFEPEIDFPANYTTEVTAAYGGDSGYPSPSHAQAHSTWYIVEMAWGATNVVVTYRDATTLAVIGSWSHAYAYTDDRWLMVGVTLLYGTAAGSIDIAGVHEYDSHDVTVTGLSSGMAVRLHDAADDSVLASAVETGGTATLDCSLVDWFGLTCYIVVYEDSSYVAELARSADVTDPGGGDGYTCS